MNNTDLSEEAALLKASFEMDDALMPTDETALLNVLAQRISDLLETQPEYLMSLLYRLDVLESKIRPVMHPGAIEPVNIGLARLVLERQKQRVETKRSVRTTPLEDTEDWNW
jgi:hypothetical protein